MRIYLDGFTDMKNVVVDFITVKTKDEEHNLDWDYSSCDMRKSNEEGKYFFSAIYYGVAVDGEYSDEIPEELFKGDFILCARNPEDETPDRSFLVSRLDITGDKDDYCIPTEQCSTYQMKC